MGADVNGGVAGFEKFGEGGDLSRLDPLRPCRRVEPVRKLDPVAGREFEQIDAVPVLA